jgi:5-methylcytosine-specific restriction endonuclease McrA
MRIEHTEPDYAAIGKKADTAFVCAHKETTRCKKVKSDQQIEIREQCQRCGDKVGHAIRKDTMAPQDIARLPLWDSQLGGRYCTERNHFYTEALNREKLRLLDDWRQRYARYLESEAWKQRRQLVMLRAQGICEGCRMAQAVDVHHLTYGDAGDEFLFQLVALCRKCHARWHQPEPPGYVPPATPAKPSPAQSGAVP